MGRLEKGVYSDKNAFIRDAAFAFAGQMKKQNQPKNLMGPN